MIDLPNLVLRFVIHPNTGVLRSEIQFPGSRAADDRIDGRSVRKRLQIGMLVVIDDFTASNVVFYKAEIKQPEPEVAVSGVIHTSNRTRVVTGSDRFQPIGLEFGSAGLNLADAATQQTDPHQSVTGSKDRIHFVIGQVSHVVAGKEILERIGIVDVVEDAQPAATTDPDGILLGIFLNIVNNIVEQRVRSARHVFIMHITGRSRGQRINQPHHSGAPRTHPDITRDITCQNMCFTQHGIVASIGAILTDIITQQTLIESGDPQVQFVILDDGGDRLDGTTRRIGDRDGMKITVERIFAEKALVAADPDAVARIAQNDCDVAIRQLWIFVGHDVSRNLVEPKKAVLGSDPQVLVMVLGNDIDERVEQPVRNITHTVGDGSVSIVAGQSVISWNPDISIGILIKFAHFVRRQNVGR